MLSNKEQGNTKASAYEVTGYNAIIMNGILFRKQSLVVNNRKHIWNI